MKPGLVLHVKSQNPVGRWVAAGILVILIAITAWYGYRWYTTGDVPPMVPVPASALADTSIDQRDVTEAQKNAHSVAKQHPRYLSIPSIGVDNARVFGVGLDQNNMLMMPKNVHDSGWYDKSALPGSGMGAVVLDGRSRGSDGPGIFFRLPDLAEGELIIVERGDGQLINYMVKEVKTVGIKEAIESAVPKMMTPIDTTKEGLSLIAESGNWIPRDKVYSERVLVRAVVKD